MDVVALLTRPLHSQLTIVLGSQHRLIRAGGWDSLRDAVQHNVTDVVVVDPLADGSARSDAIADLHRHFPSLPIVVYTTMTPESTRAILDLGRIGIEHVVFHRFDDERRRFLDLLERVPGQVLGDEMLLLLAPELTRLPVPLIRAVEQLFRSPARFKTAQHLADAAGTMIRTLYRQLEGAGIRSPRLFVAAARLLRAYSLMRDPGRQIKEVAAKVGYHSQYQLSQHMRSLTGHTPRVIRSKVEPAEFVAMLAQGVRQPRQRKQDQEQGRS